VPAGGEFLSKPLVSGLVRDVGPAAPPALGAPLVQNPPQRVDVLQREESDARVGRAREDLGVEPAEDAAIALMRRASTG
jgi:hypothetical protein